jgi:hypothetical protein
MITDVWACRACGINLASGAYFCIACGIDQETGRRRSVQSPVDLARKGAIPALSAFSGLCATWCAAWLWSVLSQRSTLNDAEIAGCIAFVLGCAACSLGALAWAGRLATTRRVNYRSLLVEFAGGILLFPVSILLLGTLAFLLYSLWPR